MLDHLWQLSNSALCPGSVGVILAVRSETHAAQHAKINMHACAVLDIANAVVVLDVGERG